MGVTVIGTDYDNVDGLQMSLQATFKTHRSNGDIILNLEDAARARADGRKDGPKKGDPRPAYMHQPFPTFRHHADGRALQCASPAEVAAAEAQGFRVAPYPVVRVAVGDPKAEKAALELKLRESAGQVATLNELLLNLGARLAAVEANGANAEPEAKIAKAKR